MERVTRFVDVLLAAAVPKAYTYRVPHELFDAVGVGQRVVVQFGKSKRYSGLIVTVHTNPPQEYQAKYIDSVLDSEPVVLPSQLKFWQWMADYYLCTMGEVMKAAMPTGYHLASETKLLLNPDYDLDARMGELSDNEYLVVEALQVQEVLSVEDVSQLLQRKTVHQIIKGLIEHGAILVEEAVKERYKPRMVQFVRLAAAVQSEEALHAVFDSLARAPKQLELLMAWIKLSNWFSADVQEVKKTALQKAVEATSTQVSILEKKGVFEIYEREEGRLPGDAMASDEAKNLSPHQQEACDAIKSEWETKDVVLLHGVTSSGKTEVYVRLMQEAISRGEKVLYLLPEIALTTQIINRLQRYFGSRVGVFHSRFNQHERVEVWQDVMSHGDGRYDILIGARSALFLPFRNLGLIIVDEEHESSFKQFNPAPRYNARDSAIVLAALHKAKVLLGSATPAVESYWNASQGKYGLVEMTKRFGGTPMPEVLVSDVKEATRKKLMKSHFSPFLIEQMNETLERGEQIILFQNRRGFSPYIQCDTCAWIPMCTRCDVSLTYHKAAGTLRCHYCGYSLRAPNTCSACGDTNIKMKGFGTEKIEEELPLYFKDAKVARMDLDTTRAKHAYQRILNAFEEREIDILVGTQMVTKGLDFDNVGLVGVLNADNMLFYPDFRAHERSYQLMAQVSGRAGRKDKRGRVVIQTFNPYHAIIRNVIDNDYHAMYQNQVLERRNFHYPPFYRLIRITMRHRDVDRLNASADTFAAWLRARFPDRVLGPEFPAVSRIRNYYHKHVILKFEREVSPKKVKASLMEVVETFRAHQTHRSVFVSLDVDPA